MGYKTLELTLISARDLKNVNLIGKMDVYVVVYLSGDPRSKHKTPVHQDGGTSPYWNHTVRFTIDDAVAVNSGWVVVFQLKHEHTFGADKVLGEVRVPLKELIDGNKNPHILTYQVRRPSGKTKGELKFSYKVNDVFVHQPNKAVPAYPPQASTTSTAYSAQQNVYPPPQTAYPYPAQTVYPPPPPASYGGYAPPPQQPYGYGYGYPVQVQQPQRQRKNGGFGMGLGAGLLGGALGGLLIEDMVSDAYDDGYYDAGAGDFDMDF